MTLVTADERDTVYNAHIMETMLLTSEIQDRMLEKSRQLSESFVNLRYEGKVSNGKNLKQARQILCELRRIFHEHSHIEDERVFPFLKKHIPKVESLTEILRLEHEYLCDLIDKFELEFVRFTEESNRLKRARMVLEMQKRGLYLNFLLQGHVQLEIQNLYQTVNGLLKPGERRELGLRKACQAA